MDGPHFVDSKLDSFLLGFGDPSNVFICFEDPETGTTSLMPLLSYAHVTNCDMLFVSWWGTIYS